MRSPDRIEPFMQLVTKVWKEKCPDWRFGQLMLNILDDIGAQAFYMEEPEMLQYIEDYFKEE